MQNIEDSGHQNQNIEQLPVSEPVLSQMVPFQCDECSMPLWKAGTIVPPGTYTRVDNRSYLMVMLEQEGPLPATFDGHIALYCTAACACREHALRRHSGEQEVSHGLFTSSAL
jgi:hypothetical protein